MRLSANWIVIFVSKLSLFVCMFILFNLKQCVIVSSKIHYHRGISSGEWLSFYVNCIDKCI